MCLIKEEGSPVKAPQSPRSPWAKLLNRQNKPKLPRKVTSSARVNLNKCWSKLGELMSGTTTQDPTTTEAEPLVISFSDFFYPVDPIKPTAEEVDNNENQKLLNCRFEVFDSLEASDNTANEVKEICYAANKRNCYVCKLCN